MRTLTSLAFVLASVHALCNAQEMRSVQTEDKTVQLIIQNKSSLPLQIHWVDFKGNSTNYGALQAGQTLPLETHPGHLWKFLASQQAVGSYRATSADKQTFSISGGDSTPSEPMKEADKKVGDFFRKFRDRDGKGKTNKVKMVPGQPQNVTPTVVATAPGVASVAAGKSGSGMNEAEANKLLQYHNEVRAEVGVGKVTWSPELARYAQEWADHLAKTGEFEHRPPSQKKYGENLAAGSNPNYDGLSGAKGWYGEKPLYKKGAPFSEQYLPAGHYTQMVWRGSTRIGAGKAVCTKGQYKGWTIVVCNYNPGGNMLGQPAY